MNTAQNLLAELEAIGAVGGVSAPPALSMPPAPSPTDSEPVAEPKARQPDRSLQVMQLCERAVDTLTRSIEVQSELRDIFIQLHDLFVPDEEEAPLSGPGEEEEEEEEEEKEDDSPSDEAAAKPQGSLEDRIPEISDADSVGEAEPESALVVPPAPSSPPVASPRRQRFLEQMRKDAEKASKST